MCVRRKDKITFSGAAMSSYSNTNHNQELSGSAESCTK